MKVALRAINLTRRVHAVFLAVLSCASLCLASFEARAGKLDRVSDAARSSDSSSSSSNSSSGSSNSSSDSSCSSCSSDSSYSSGDGDGGAGALILIYAITSPWWGPKAALESAPRYSSGFPRYPYETPGAGSMIVEPEPDRFEPVEPVEPGTERPLSLSSPVRTRSWSFQLGAESGYVFDRVWREGLNLRLQTAARIDFDANWSLFMEREPGAFTNLAMGREHIVWRFAQSSNVQFHTSLGAQHLVDARGSVGGIDFAYGFEVYPAKPVTFALEGAVGNLDSVFAPRVRATLGFVDRRFEFQLGYEHQWIGTESLGGPFMGLRLWL